MLSPSPVIFFPEIPRNVLFTFVFSSLILFLPASSENIRKVLVFVPSVDICESPNELLLFADMPGVPMENVEVDLEGDRRYYWQ